MWGGGGKTGFIKMLREGSGLACSLEDKEQEEDPGGGEAGRASQVSLADHAENGVLV